MSTSLGLPGQQAGQQTDDKNIGLKGSISAMDTNTMLLHLAGKPPKKGDATVSTQQKDKKKGKSKTKAISESVHVNKKKDTQRNSKLPGNAEVAAKSKISEKNAISEAAVKSELDDKSSPISDLCADDLDETEMATLRELFNTLDHSNTGIITAENIFEELRHVDSEITFSDVEEALKNVDKDGNGLIDFDEFLSHMTAMGGDPIGGEEGSDDEEKRKKRSRRKRLFYSAITHFSIMQTLAYIEKSFRMQIPHVISHYTAGARLIGLTTRQLERQMKKMQKSAGKNDSPYAKPLQFVQFDRKGQNKFVKKKKIMDKAGVKDKEVSSQELQKRELDEQEADPTVNNLTKKIQDTMMMFAQQRGSIVGDANIIIKLRERLGSVTARILEQKVVESDNTLATSTMPSLNMPKSATLRSYEETQTSLKPKAKSAAVKPPGKKEKLKNFMVGMGWTTPKIHYIDVPLPSLKMKLTSEKPTFNDLHRIRAKAKQAIDAYYHNLRQAEIRNAWQHWDRLYADVIVPTTMLSNFKTVYAAYSPNREEEAFVVCPWKPGPFRFLRHIQKSPRAPKSPDIAISRQNSRNRVVHPRNLSSCQQRYARGSPLFRNTPSPLGRACSSLGDADRRH